MGKRRKRRFPDRQTVGRSQVVPFLQHEPARERHARRLETNLELFSKTAADWCLLAGVDLKIRNDGHHWIFKRQDTFVEWWPSSAKCVVDKKWRKGVHVHDWLQLTKILEKAFGASDPTRPGDVRAAVRNSDQQHKGASDAG